MTCLAILEQSVFPSNVVQTCGRSAELCLRESWQVPWVATAGEDEQQVAANLESKAHAHWHPCVEVIDVIPHRENEVDD